MNKTEFILKLCERLSCLPQEEMEERLLFYSEMIDDRMEEGLSEEEAVSAIGSIDEIAAQIIAEVSFAKLGRERIKPRRRLRAGEIVLLALGAPIWLSLGIAAFAVMVCVYASIWSVIISLWAVFVSLAICSVGSIVTCSVFTMRGNSMSGIAVLSAGIVCAGFSVFVFYGCKTATKGFLTLTKKLAVWLKNCFIKREER